MTPETMLTFDNETKPINEWALDYGITPSIIIARLERGETIANAITKPMKIGHPSQRLPAFHRKQRETVRRRRHVWPAPVPSVMGRPQTTLSFNGETRTLREWAQVIGVTYHALCARKRKGWSIEQMLTTPRLGAGGPGVVSNLSEAIGTDAGSTARETAQKDFSGKTE